MMIHEITEKVGRYKARKRVGRGRASGVGKTSGRGHKGAGQRSGNSYRPYFEGGQMPFVRRIPKRGFTNHDFRTIYAIVNVKALEQRFDDGASIDAEALVKIGLIRNTKLPVKVLGEGELSKRFTVTAAKFSGSARAKIEKAGGTCEEVPVVKWTRESAAAKAEAGGSDEG
ncbi:MAG: 50S ribosomal protein L15 [Planctomycetota bacterium]|jgi:large subunit ribosomal protein L15